MRVAGSAALLLSAVAVVAAPVPPPPATPPGGLLVLDNCDPDFRGKANYGDNLSGFDRSGKLRFRAGGFNNAGGVGCNRRVAVDPARKAVWVLEDAPRRVRKFDLAGKELLCLKDLRANALAVDPDTGNLWVATARGEIYGHRVAVYSKDGKRLVEHDVGGWDIAYDAKGKALWVVGKHLCKISAKQLTPARPADLVVRKDVAGWCAACVSVNRKTGQVWVVSREYQKGYGKDELLGFDNGARLNVTVPLGGDDETRFPFHASVDSKTGSVWVAIMRHEVRRFTADGKPDGRFKFRALAVQADEATGGAWVFTEEEILRISSKGAVTRRLKHQKSTSEVWIAAY